MRHYNMQIQIIHYQKGFGIVEIIVAMAVFITIAIASVTVILQSFNINRLGNEETKANLYAQESIEAVRSLKKRGWFNMDIGSTTCGATVTRGLSNSGGSWAFSGTSDTIDKYTRTVTIGNVCRDGSGNISDSGTIYDPDVKKVASTIGWTFIGNRSDNVTLTAYLSRWNKLVGSCDWATSSVQGAYNFSSNNYVKKIQAQGDYIYMVLNDPGTAPFDFAILNVTTPSAPTLVGTLNLPGNPINLAVAGHYAYIASDNNNEELQIVDFENDTITKPYVYNAAGTGDAYGVFVVGSLVYLSKEGSNSPELFVINFNPASPAFPTLNGSAVDIGGNNQGGREVWVSGNFAYIASSHNTEEVKVVNLTTRTVVANYNLPGGIVANTITGANSYLYVGASNNAIYVFDISSPPTLSLTTSYTAPAGVNDLSTGFSNALLFEGTSNNTGNEFESFDLDMPSTLTFLSGIDMSRTVYGVAADEFDCVAYAGTDPNGAGEELAVIMPGTGATPTPTPTPTPGGPTNTPTLTPTSTPTGTPTNTPTPTTSINSCSSYCVSQGFSTGLCRRTCNAGESSQAGGSAYCPAPGDSGSARNCCCQ